MSPALAGSYVPTPAQSAALRQGAAFRLEELAVQAHGAMEESLRDYSTAQFRDTRGYVLSKSGANGPIFTYYLCGKINPANAMGGRAGWHDFIIAVDGNGKKAWIGFHVSHLYDDESETYDDAADFEVHEAGDGLEARFCGGYNPGTEAEKIDYSLFLSKNMTATQAWTLMQHLLHG